MLHCTVVNNVTRVTYIVSYISTLVLCRGVVGFCFFALVLCSAVVNL